jgi:hypothetical protein
MINSGVDLDVARGWGLYVSIRRGYAPVILMILDQLFQDYSEEFRWALDHDATDLCTGFYALGLNPSEAVARALLDTAVAKNNLILYHQSLQFANINTLPREVAQKHDQWALTTIGGFLIHSMLSAYAGQRLLDLQQLICPNLSQNRLQALYDISSQSQCRGLPYFVACRTPREVLDMARYCVDPELYSVILSDAETHDYPLQNLDVLYEVLH